MGSVLIHLHPDFSNELALVVEQWNQAQKEKQFIGVHPRREQEKKLLTGGSIDLYESFKIAAQIRTESGYSPDDEILVFTEKRIFTGQYQQLYFGGTSKHDSLPNVDVVSLDFTRRLFNSLNKDKEYVFQAILLNILNAQAQHGGLRTHNDTRGCILDFCNNMPDILIGLEKGPQFCDQDTDTVRELGKNYLFDLARVVKKRGPDLKNDGLVSKRILSSDKPRLDNDEPNFDYDIVISFAGEDRYYAEQLATKLQQLNIKVFYDGFEKAKLWGEDLYVYLTDLYRFRAKYCIMFLSQSYSTKLWTSHERKAAQSRAFNENNAYILPIRLDNTSIPGILDTVGYLSWQKEGVDEIVECIKQKLS